MLKVSLQEIKKRKYVFNTVFSGNNLCFKQAENCDCLMKLLNKRTRRTLTFK